jgi:hypothetical protein
VENPNPIEIISGGDYEIIYTVKMACITTAMTTFYFVFKLRCAIETNVTVKQNRLKAEKLFIFGFFRQFGSLLSCSSRNTFFINGVLPTTLYSTQRTFLKGQCHEIFDLRFFSSNKTPWAPDSWAKAFLNSASNSPRYDRFSNRKNSACGVNDNACTKIVCKVSPLNLFIFSGVG